MHARRLLKYRWLVYHLRELHLHDQYGHDRMLGGG